MKDKPSKISGSIDKLPTSLRLAIIGILGLVSLVGGGGIAGYLLGRKDGGLSDKPDAGLVKKSEPDGGDSRKCIKRVVEFKFPDPIHQCQSMSDEEIKDRAEEMKEDQIAEDVDKLCSQYCIKSSHDRDQIYKSLQKGFKFHSIKLTSIGWEMYFTHPFSDDLHTGSLVLTDSYLCKTPNKDELETVRIYKEREKELDRLKNEIEKGRIHEELKRFNPRDIQNATVSAGVEKYETVKSFIKIVEEAQSMDFNTMSNDEKKKFTCRMLLLSDIVDSEGNEEINDKITNAIGNEIKSFFGLIEAFGETLMKDTEECMPFLLEMR